MKHNLLDGSGLQGVPEAERMTRLELMEMVLRDHNVAYQVFRDHLLLTGEGWVPNVTPVTHLLRVATDARFLDPGFLGRRWWKLDAGWQDYEAPQHVLLESREVWLRDTRPVKDAAGRVLPGRVYLEPFELVSFPILFWDEGSEVARRTRRYLKLFHYPKEAA